MYWMKFEDFLRLSGLSLNPESPHMMSGREEQIEDRWAAVISSILGKWGNGRSARQEVCSQTCRDLNLPFHRTMTLWWGVHAECE
ncbi:MAG: hypothetical protein OCU22_06350 [Canidatus Methanoxibalbensis ujae]|nr:hypothetical protein [Candidatus Methanoxibalbensis ujae]